MVRAVRQPQLSSRSARGKPRKRHHWMEFLEPNAMNLLAPVDHTRIATLVRRRAAIEGRRTSALQEREGLMADVGQAKARVELQDAVRAVLDRLQKAEHERSVGSFERLLTAFLQDVLPDPLEVAMDLYTDKGLPSLDLYVRKGPGAPAEDAYSGMGGAVTNILSAGLRIISLLRSGRRRFLVLDEADCWISPMHIPAFARVIHEISQQFGVQILMITHHNEEMFEGILPHRLRLERSEGGLSAQWSPTSDIPVWEPEQDGIRMIELAGFQAHVNTLLPLSPGITFLQGANNLGKSSINAALRAVFYGEGPETVINHDASQADVKLHLERNRTLEWSRFRKGRVKVSHRLMEPGNPEPTRSSTSARGVPDWLVEETGIGMVDDLDIQLRHQKEPVFLLNEPASKRAKALAVGLEGSYIQNMMTMDRQDILDARGVVRTGERTLEQLARLLEATEGLLENDPDLPHVAQEIETGRRDQARAFQLVKNWTGAHGRGAALEGMPQLAPVSPAAPQSPHLRLLAERWTRDADKREAYLPLDGAKPTAPAAPNAQPRRLLARWQQAAGRKLPLTLLGEAPGTLATPATPTQLLHRWQVLAARRLAISLPAPPVAPNAGNAGAARKAMERWTQGETQLQILQGQAAELTQELVTVEAELATHICSACGQALPDHVH